MDIPAFWFQVPCTAVIEEGDRYYDHGCKTYMPVGSKDIGNSAFEFHCVIRMGYPSITAKRHLCSVIDDATRKVLADYVVWAPTLEAARDIAVADWSMEASCDTTWYVDGCQVCA